jgi:hypothetical protein
MGREVRLYFLGQFTPKDELAFTPNRLLQTLTHRSSDGTSPLAHTSNLREDKRNEDTCAMVDFGRRRRAHRSGILWGDALARLLWTAPYKWAPQQTLQAKLEGIAAARERTATDPAVLAKELASLRLIVEAQGQPIQELIRAQWQDRKGHIEPTYGAMVGGRMLRPSSPPSAGATILTGAHTFFFPATPVKTPTDDAGDKDAP